MKGPANQVDSIFGLLDACDEWQPVREMLFGLVICIGHPNAQKRGKLMNAFTLFAQAAPNAGDAAGLFGCGGAVDPIRRQRADLLVRVLEQRLVCHLLE